MPLNEIFFASTIDLKDAYYLIPVAESSRKLLRFLINGHIRHLHTTPCVLTEVMKPVVAYLESVGYLSIIHLNDNLIIGDRFPKCLRNVVETTAIVQELGFIINWKKSQISPCTRVTLLGLIFDTRNTAIELPDNNKSKALQKISTARKHIVK